MLISDFEINDDGECVDVTIEVTYFTAGCPAKLNALPEDCYEEEYPEISYLAFVDGVQLDSLDANHEATLTELVLEKHIESLEPEPDEDTPRGRFHPTLRHY